LCGTDAARTKHSPPRLIEMNLKNRYGDYQVFPPSNPSKVDFQAPGVAFQPATFRGLVRGINTLMNAIRPTLGPFPRLVGIEPSIGRNRKPEILDSGGTIARRIIQIQGRNADVGAMFMRHMLWKLQEKAGDGTATAAVLFQALFVGGIKYIVAGGNSMRLRVYLDQGLRIVLEELDHQIIQLNAGGGAASRRERLTGLAESISRDPELSRYLGEIFDIIGAYGRLEVRAGSGLQFKREYVEGIYWDNGLHSRAMLDDYKAGRSTLENAVVVISNLDLEEPADMGHVLQVALDAGASHVLLVANSVSDRALSVALHKPNREKVKLLAVKTPGVSASAQEQAITDIAILTGGRPLLKVTLDTFQGLSTRDVGRARRISTEMENFSIIGGKGDSRRFRQHIRELQQSFRSAEDLEARQALHSRISQLMGGSATLFTGGVTQSECEDRKALAEHVATVMRSAILEGVLPGGGVALLAARARLDEMRRQAGDVDERAAYALLAQAMEAPFRALLANAGYDSGQTMAFMAQAGPGTGIDLKTGQLANMLEVGIVDPASVLKTAAASAISSAGLLLTTDVIVHLRNPPQENPT
jgi:chaperonin GroEL